MIVSFGYFALSLDETNRAIRFIQQKGTNRCPEASNSKHSTCCRACGGLRSGLPVHRPMATICAR
jgi:hypothetical protein